MDTVGMTAGGVTIQRGPLSEVANRCVAAYQLLDPTTNEGQEQKSTLAADNTASQARYGIQQYVLAAGAVTAARAQQIRDAHLAMSAWPRVPKQAALGGAAVSASLTCLGYYHWLNYPYRLANVTGTVDASAKISTVLASDPNGFFAGPHQIAANTLQVHKLEDQSRLSSEIISDIVAMGGANFARYLFGVWAGRSASYAPAPMYNEYQQRSDDKRLVIENMSGDSIPPWAVLPGKWVALTSILPGSLAAPNPTTAIETENAMFIEQVKFTSPYGLSLSDSRVNTFRQQLAQWGITGN